MPSRQSRPEMKLVRELAAILCDSDLDEIEIEQENLRIRVKKQAPPLVTSTMHSPLVMPVSPGIADPVVPASAAPVQQASTPTLEKRNSVNSPMVGTVYHAPEPGMDAFVTVGSTVEKGDTLMLIEAMKTFNPVKAPERGTVREILVADSQPVEFGEPLVIIE